MSLQCKTTRVDRQIDRIWYKLVLIMYSLSYQLDVNNALGLNHSCEHRHSEYQIKKWEYKPRKKIPFLWTSREQTDTLFIMKVMPYRKHRTLITYNANIITTKIKAIKSNYTNEHKHKWYEHAHKVLFLEIVTITETFQYLQSRKFNHSSSLSVRILFHLFSVNVRWRLWTIGHRFRSKATNGLKLTAPAYS